MLQNSNYRGDLVLTLENIVRAYFEIARDHPIFYRLQLSMYFSPPDSETNHAIRPFALAQRKILEKLFIQAAEDHGNFLGRHSYYVASFLGVINALIGLYLNDKIVLREEMIYRVVHQYMHGIFS